MRKKQAKIVVLCLFIALALVPWFACGQSLGDSTSGSTDALSEGVSATSVYSDRSTATSETQSPVLPSIADVVALVKPSVVTIDTETTYRFFNRTYTQEGAGSGWTIDESGVIVTNNHVIDGARRIIVTLNDGRTFTVDPEEIATDEQRDLAILRIDDTENLPAIAIGDPSALRVGDWVVSIGNPLGLGISAKEGIVSRLDVSLPLEGRTLGNLIETSAAINPGNSGGPLVNMRGEVVGITSAKISSVGVEGLAYAISIGEAMPALDELMSAE